MLLPMYRYVVVRIYGNDYLVPTYESVPMDSVVVRSNDKMFIGMRKAL
jgi:predicted P-loop ATPase/GTPase